MMTTRLSSSPGSKERVCVCVWTQCESKDRKWLRRWLMWRWDDDDTNFFYWWCASYNFCLVATCDIVPCLFFSLFLIWGLCVSIFTLLVNEFHTIFWTFDACFGFGHKNKIGPMFRFKCHFNNCLQPIGKAKGFLISQITSGEEGRDSKLNYYITFFYIINYYALRVKGKKVWGNI